MKPAKKARPGQTGAAAHGAAGQGSSAAATGAVDSATGVVVGGGFAAGAAGTAGCVPAMEPTGRRLGQARSLALVWRRCLLNSLADRSAYRGDFVLGTLVTLLFELVTPLVTVLLYSASGQSGFPGWSMAEALLIQALFLCSRGIAYPLFFSTVWTVHGLVRAGNFELVLLKPRSPLLVCMSRSLNLQSLARLAGGLSLLVWCLSQLPPPGPLDWVLFGLLMGLSVLVMFGFTLFMAATLFVWVGNSRLMELVESLFLFGQYPLSIFGAGFQVLLSVVLPIAMLAWFPALALLGRAQAGWGMFGWPALMAGLFVLAGWGLWNHMIKRYSGAGG